MDEDEFTLFSTKIVLDIEADDEEDLTAKRLSFSHTEAATNIEQSIPSVVAPISSSPAASPAPVNAHVHQPHPTSASTRAPSSSPVTFSTSASKRVTRSSVLLRPADESDAFAPHVSPRRPQQQLHHHHQLSLPAQPSYRAEEAVRFHAAPIETVPVAMENSRNPMWFTWLSGFVVLFLVSSSMWSPARTVDQAPIGDAAPHQVNEPRLPFKNYSIPRFTINASANVSGDASRTEDAVAAAAALPEGPVDYVFLPIDEAQNATSAAAPAGVATGESPVLVQEDDEEGDEAAGTLTTSALDWQRFAVSVPSLTISMGGHGFVGDADVVTPAAVDEEPLEVAADATVAAADERPATVAMETPVAEAAPVLEAIAADAAVDAVVHSVPLSDAPAIVEAEVPEAVATAVAEDEDETAATAVPAVTIDNAVDVLDALATVDADVTPIDSDRDVPVVQAVSTPILFPANMNIAEANTGARVVARESTKRCVKTNKWNPLQCHRPLKTVNSHFPIASALDCFAFYLEHDASASQKNTLTVELFQPAKAIYGFGLSHFLADAGHEDARFNASCAPRDISFTVYENIPAPSSSSSGRAVAEASPSKQLRFPFTWESVKQQIQRDADSIAPVIAKTSRAPPAPRRFLPSVEIPTTFDGVVFDPLGSRVAQTMQSPPQSRGATVTEFFPLSTAFFPQYVHKVSMHVHSTQSGGDVACVYRVQVYGDFDTDA